MEAALDSTSIDPQAVCRSAACLIRRLSDPQAVGQASSEQIAYHCAYRATGRRYTVGGVHVHVRYM